MNKIIYIFSVVSAVFFTVFVDVDIMSVELTHAAYHHYNTGKVAGVEYYQDDEVVGKESLFWSESSSTLPSLLIGKQWENREGLLLFRSFEYDEDGLFIGTTLYGNLSGKEIKELVISEEGVLIDNGIERYATTLTYTTRDGFLFINQTEDNGKAVLYRYDPNTQRLDAEFMGDGESIYQRRFFDYNEEGALSQMIIDNGISENIDDLTGVHERRLVTFCYPAESDQPYTTKEEYFDFDSNTFYSFSEENKTFSFLSYFGQWCQNIKKKFSYEKSIDTARDYIAHQLFSESFLKMYGYYPDSSMSGCYYPGHECKDNVRVTMINGILNVKKDMEENLEQISTAHGNVTVHYVFRSTDGWTRDMFNSWFVRVGCISMESRLLGELWKKLIDEMGGPGQGGVIIHYAHSLGASDTWAAKSLLTVEEQQMIHVVAIGPARIVPSGIGFGSVHNYVSKYDGVSIIIDPVGYLNGCLSASHVHLLDSEGIPLLDHTLNSTAYAEIIRVLGAKFIQTHGKPGQIHETIQE